MKIKTFTSILFVMLFCLHGTALGDSNEFVLDIAFTSNVNGEILPHRL